MGKEIDAIANLAFSSSSSHRQAKRFQSNQQRIDRPAPLVQSNQSLSPFDETVMLATNTISDPLHRVATITDHFSVSQAMPLILSVFSAGGRGLVEEELVLCRGDVSNSPRLDSFDCCSLSLECQEHPLKALGRGPSIWVEESSGQGPEASKRGAKGFEESFKREGVVKELQRIVIFLGMVWEVVPE
ncbi:hypothetical protein Bca52824_032931 [Brassica carinata]|uniref:Uncharacterized protein n=1 Tax=Brassica carinata TaxID=52824 RepID=A0A8X7SCZ3_BRACI|nr:hypothetical protein Bca52824_032931 [Brassica carinata]